MKAHFLGLFLILSTTSCGGSPADGDPFAAETNGGAGSRAIAGVEHSWVRPDGDTSRAHRPAPGPLPVETCAGSEVEVIDDGAKVKLGSSCAANMGLTDSTHPLGYYVESGFFSRGSELVLDGCKDERPGSTGVEITVSGSKRPGAELRGTLVYTDPEGAIWTAEGDDLALSITNVGDVGGVIRGTFAALVTRERTRETKGIHGNFRVCHVLDEITL
ncbi:MAG: hypothetical protein U0359_33365 [Byssovorax sp.]